MIQSQAEIIQMSNLESVRLVSDYLNKAQSDCVHEQEAKWIANVRFTELKL